MNRHLLFFIVCALFLASCNLNKDLMFRTDRDFVFDEVEMLVARDSIRRDSVRLDSAYLGWRIAPFDELDMQIFSNDGNIVIEYTTSTVDRQRPGKTGDIEYVVDAQGYVNMPSIGRQKIAGMTILEAQKYLESKYASIIINPYCVLKILNRRVMIYSGFGSTGQVVNISYQNVSLIEALTAGGGINERGNASKIKLIRTVAGKDEVYRIDLSTIEGIKYTQLPVQAGDIIYVEPLPRWSREFASSIAPTVGLINTFILLFFISKRF